MTRRRRQAWNAPWIRRHEATTLDARPGPRFRFGVIADTHGLPHRNTLEHLATRKPDAILHAGDIGDLDVLEAFRAIAPVIAVRGNIDAPATGYPEGLSLSLMEGGDEVFSLFMTHIAVQRGRLRTEIRDWARRRDAQIVVCGHSHVPLLVRDGPYAVFNPGSCGPRRFDLPILFGQIDIAPEGVTMHHISCETGERWRPAMPR